MKRGGAFVEFRFEGLGVEPDGTGFVKQGELVGHAVKLSPQEQLVAAFGLVTLKPPSVSESM